jgi:hypothetical protein
MPKRKRRVAPKRSRRKPPPSRPKKRKVVAHKRRKVTATPRKVARAKPRKVARAKPRKVARAKPPIRAALPLSLLVTAPELAVRAPERIVPVTAREKQLVAQVRKQERIRAMGIRAARKTVEVEFAKMKNAWVTRAQAPHWNRIRPGWHAAKARLWTALQGNYPEYAALLNKLVKDAGLQWIIDYRPETLTGLASSG